MIPRLYEHMDVFIDQDPRIVACHPHEATSLHVYLFLLRRGRIEGHPGRVNPKSANTFYMSRLLFLPEEVCRISLESLISNGLVTIHCNGVTVTLEASLGVTDLISGAEYLQITGWEGASSREVDRVAPDKNAERQKRYRERQKAQHVADREAAKSLGAVVVDNPVDKSMDNHDYNTASRDVTRDAITEQNRTEQSDQIVVPDSSGTSKSSDPPDPKVRRPRKPKPRPERISERALRGADYLRAMVLDRNPEADIGRRPWDGVKRPPNVYRQPPPDPLRAIGYRLKWADEIRLLVEQDEATYEQVGEVIKWLWYNQPPELGAGFIVESADSLRAKWPRIRGMMRGRARPGAGDGTAADDVGRAREKLESLIAKANGDAGTAAGQDGQP